MSPSNGRGICGVKLKLGVFEEIGLYQGRTVVILFPSVKTKTYCKKDWFCNGNFLPLLPFPLQVNAVIGGISLEYGI